MESVSVTLRIPVEILERVDAQAAAEGATRSFVINRMLRMVEARFGDDNVRQPLTGKTVGVRQRKTTQLSDPVDTKTAAPEEPGPELCSYTEYDTAL